MMNWLWFLIIVAMGLPGIVIMSVGERKIVKEMDPAEEEVPAYLGFLVHLFLVVLFAGIGTWLLDKTNFTTPDFNEINMVTIAVGTIVAIVHLLYYYGIVGTRVEKEVMMKIDKARSQLGILTRVFYGGVVEEIIFRWGLMSLFVWLGSFFIQDSNILYWMAIVLAAIVCHMLFHLVWYSYERMSGRLVETHQPPC
jgi:hypothetical protein